MPGLRLEKMHGEDVNAGCNNQDDEQWNVEHVPDTEKSVIKLEGGRLSHGGDVERHEIDDSRKALGSLPPRPAVSLGFNRQELTCDTK